MTVEIVRLVKCDRCKKVIETPTDGFIIAGDVYVARVNEDGEPDGGLIGANFPTPSQAEQDRLEGLGEDFKFTYTDVRKVCYCTSCLLGILNIHKIPGSVAFRKHLADGKGAGMMRNDPDEGSFE